MQKSMEGMTLLELLLVISLCGFIMLLLNRFFIASQQQVAFTRGQLTIQYHGQLLSHLLRDDIHHAGLFHCHSMIHNSSIAPMNLVLGVKSFSKKTSDTPSAVKRRMVSNTEGLEVRSLQPIVKLNATASLNHLPNSVKLKSGDILLLTDCQQTQEVRVDTVYQRSKDQVVTLHTALKKFPQGFWVDKYVDTFYYIAKPSYASQLKYPLYSLYIKQANQRAQELVPGVSQLKADFMTRSGKVFANTESHDWKQINLVHLQLLLDSVDAIGLDRRTYRFADQLITPENPKLYQAWSIWAALP